MRYGISDFTTVEIQFADIEDIGGVIPRDRLSGTVDVRLNIHETSKFFFWLSSNVSVKTRRLTSGNSRKHFDYSPTYST